MKPKSSYRIWFTQRSGSTLLCRGLERTRIAGMPGEFFNLMDTNSLGELHQANDYQQLKEKMWQLGTSDNGIFGIKHSFHTSRTEKLFDEFKALQNIPLTTHISYEKLTADLFPNCKHIFLTRRNKIRQAVSWWKAIQDQVWHIDSDKAAYRNDADFYDKHYNFDALTHLFKETMLKECAIQEYFETYNIKPLTIVYEDMIKDFNGTLKTIIDYLEIDYSTIHFGALYYQKTSNEQSEQWVQRFRHDIQKNMSEQIW